MNTTAKNLRIHTREILEAVERGQEVVITVRGKPRAKIVPVRGRRTAAKAKKTSPLFGIWKDHAETRNVLEYVNRLRSGRF